MSCCYLISQHFMIFTGYLCYKASPNVTVLGIYDPVCRRKKSYRPQQKKTRIIIGLRIHSSARTDRLRCYVRRPNGWNLPENLLHSSGRLQTALLGQWGGVGNHYRGLDIHQKVPGACAGEEFVIRLDRHALFPLPASQNSQQSVCGKSNIIQPGRLIYFAIVDRDHNPQNPQTYHLILSDGTI